MSRLTAGGPHYYALRPDSTVGGEVYERELLTRLPARGIDVRYRRRAVHWVLAPLVYTPYVLVELGSSFRNRQVHLKRCDCSRRGL